MGRGRQKAKNAKIARQLKYQGPQTDLQELKKELSADRGYDESNPRPVNAEVRRIPERPPANLPSPNVHGPTIPDARGTYQYGDD